MRDTYGGARVPWEVEGRREMRGKGGREPPPPSGLALNGF